MINVNIWMEFNVM